MKATTILLLVLLGTALTVSGAEIGGTGMVILQRASAEEPLRTGMSFPKSPAHKAGIPLHGFLISVNRTNVVSMHITNAVSMIRGPVGTFVTLEIADGARTETNTFTVKRARIVMEGKSIVEFAE